MKRGTIDHPKLLDLAARLGIEPWGAVGLLESLWHWTARYARRGDVGRYTDAQIAAGVRWSQRPASELIDALVCAGWLDRCAQHRLVIHDVADHADEAWRKSVQRGPDGHVGFVTATPITQPLRRRRVSRQCRDSVETPSRHYPPFSSFPEPEPEPEPEPVPEPEPLATTDAVETPTRDVVPTRSRAPLRVALSGTGPPGFAAFWDAYPRKVGKGAALNAWRKVGSPAVLERILAALRWQRCQPDWLRDVGRFIPHPATYLNQRRWEDEPTATPGAFATPQTAGNAVALAEALAAIDRGDA